ncbi:UDP-N-acetylmuramoyl-L-alanine--D-glutamate ligase [Oecophyllibacter saccharovorans]|uniref:UDP-N-acetylmuramoyl-L-alanine--D-glutamate ligase n=1 Tax=Oecophyllibacter saccharovorans TaxID=2558360 RepID=UPI0011424BDF|nr:UDP-N-acetylmuramoyl-L-alanine--D-glutamate ligase [Oecophyllibacter saccharovorans]QDH14666.1 UDP-N-acetylmuramoyl-L-alanine--D-glutamate ligase [Oecophyllibacter saccharovorans]
MPSPSLTDRPLPTRPWGASLLSGKRYGVYGLGRNGRAVVEALLQNGAEVQAWDDSTPELPPAPRLTVAPLSDLRGMEALILSPGIPHTFPAPHPVAALARAQNVPILSDAELLWQRVRQSGSKARFVSITGTNGKSTTTALLTHMLLEAGVPAVAGGNIGTAALALPLLGDEGVYVIEMSSYMLERLQTYQAEAAAWLNFTPDHLERHGGLSGYADAKRHVFDNMTAGQLAVLGEKAPWSEEVRVSLEQKGLTPVIIESPAIAAPEDAPALPGRHNAQNIAVCTAIARHLGLSDAQIAQGIRSFPGLEHRLQTVIRSPGRTGMLRFVNDSKATNAEAAAHALAACENIYWIAGGQAKAGGIESLTPLLGRVSHAFLIGQDAEMLAQTLRRHHVPYTISSTLEQAVEDAGTRAIKAGKGTVLLAPACASFDQFPSFEVRGRRFAELAEAFCASLNRRAAQTKGERMKDISPQNDSQTVCGDAKPEGNHGHSRKN